MNSFQPGSSNRTPPALAKIQGYNLGHAPAGRLPLMFTLLPLIPAITAASPQSADQKTHRVLAGLGAQFRDLRSEHFILKYDTEDSVAKEVSSRLEQTYLSIVAFCKCTAMTVQEPDRPLTTILFDRNEDYEAFRLRVGLPVDDSAGAFLPGVNLAVFWNVYNHPAIGQITRKIEEMERMALKSAEDLQEFEDLAGLPPKIATLRSRRDALVRNFTNLVVAHESVHQVLYNVGAETLGTKGPAWLVEGLACQFEFPQPHIADGHLLPNPMRCADLRSALGVGPEVKTVTEEQYQEALDSKRIVSLPELFAAGPLISQDPEQSAYRYAQSWALVYYLFQAHHERFAKFVRAIAAPPEAKSSVAAGSFEGLFGATDRRREIAMARFVLSEDAPPGS